MNDVSESQEVPLISQDNAVGLSYDYLKQLSTTSLTIGGGLIALMQFVKADKSFSVKILVAISFMFFSAFFAFLAQFSLIARIRQGHVFLKIDQKKNHSQEYSKRSEKIWEGLALWLLSLGLGIALQSLIVVGLRS